MKKMFLSLLLLSAKIMGGSFTSYITNDMKEALKLLGLPQDISHASVIKIIGQLTDLQSEPDKPKALHDAYLKIKNNQFGLLSLIYRLSEQNSDFNIPIKHKDRIFYIPFRRTNPKNLVEKNEPTQRIINNFNEWANNNLSSHASNVIERITKNIEIPLLINHD